MTRDYAFAMMSIGNQEPVTGFVLSLFSLTFNTVSILSFMAMRRRRLPWAVKIWLATLLLPAHVLFAVVGLWGSLRPYDEFLALTTCPAFVLVILAGFWSVNLATLLTTLTAVLYRLLLLTESGCRFPTRQTDPRDRLCLDSCHCLLIAVCTVLLVYTISILASFSTLIAILLSIRFGDKLPSCLEISQRWDLQTRQCAGVVMFNFVVIVTAAIVFLTYCQWKERQPQQRANDLRAPGEPEGVRLHAINRQQHPSPPNVRRQAPPFPRGYNREGDLDLGANMNAKEGPEDHSDDGTLATAVGERTGEDAGKGENPENWLTEGMASKVDVRKLNSAEKANYRYPEGMTVAANIDEIVKALPGPQNSATDIQYTNVMSMTSVNGSLSEVSIGSIKESVKSSQMSALTSESASNTDQTATSQRSSSTHGQSHNPHANAQPQEEEDLHVGEPHNPSPTQQDGEERKNKLRFPFSRVNHRPSGISPDRPMSRHRPNFPFQTVVCLTGCSYALVYGSLACYFIFGSLGPNFGFSQSAFSVFCHLILLKGIFDSLVYLIASHVI